MSIPELIVISIFLSFLLTLFIFAIVDQVKVNKSYRNALDSIPQLHYDLVDLVNTFKDLNNSEGVD